MTIFTEALDHPDAAAQAAYLDQACGEDAELRRRVEALLAAHRGAGRFLERMVAMGHKLLTDSPGAFFKDKGDWVPYLIMVRTWCEASEQEA